MRVHMRAFVHKIHPFFADQWTTVNTLLSSTPRMGKVIRTALGTKKSLVTVNRGPHVHKKSREQFEIRTHKRLIEIVEPTPKTIDALNKLSLPAGVDVKIRAGVR